MNTIDHKNYPKSLKTKTLAELRFIITDCNEAIAANPDAEKVKSGYYADEICYASDEIARRNEKIWGKRA